MFNSASKKTSSSLGARPVKGKHYPMIIGYVFLPSNINRKTYISDCMKNQRIAVITPQSGVISNVKIGHNAMNILSFPATPTQLGSPVAVATVMPQGERVVVEVFGEFDNTSEFEASIFKKKDGKLTGLFLDVEQGISSLQSQGNNAKVIINANGENAEVELSATQKIGFYSVELENNQEEKLTIRVGKKDSSDNTVIEIIDNEVKIDTDKIVINNGSEHGVLGDKLTEKLKKLLDLLRDAKVTTMAGPQPLLNFAEYPILKSTIDQILSEHLYLK